MTEYLKPLDAAALQAYSIDGWSYGYADRVRFYELDALNHVNNAVFLRWFETIRVQYLQDYGVTTYSQTDADPTLVVRAQTADYLAPMLHDETYIVTARTALLKPSSFVMDYAVFCDGETRATGSTVMVSLEQDGKTRRPHKPAAIQTIIERDAPATQGL